MFVVYYISTNEEHLKNVFQELQEKYKDIVLIENPYYEKCNNISSLYVAREHLENCIILDGDQIIYNKNILDPLFEKSGYCSMWTEDYTEEWLQCVEENKVLSCCRTGGRNGWQLFSVSFWNKRDGAKLKELAEFEFEQNENKDIYWDDIPMFCHSEEFDLGIRAIKRGDLIEIDSYEGLTKLDVSYL